MIRRTIALAGATALTLGVMGLAGPAEADDSVGIASGHVDINEFGILNITLGPQGAGVELLNTTSNIVPLNGWELNGCSPTGDLSLIAAFGPDDEILANGFFVIGDANLESSLGGVDVVDNDVSILEQSAGGLELVDASPARVDSLSWGMPTDTTCDGFFDVGVLPDDDETVQFDGTTWCKAAHTFKGANPNC